MKQLEAIERLKDASKYDAEIAHITADEILIEFLRKNEFSELADHYEEMSKDFWYA